LSTYLPERGDLIWVDFDPSAGSEQSGNRPAIVLSTQIFSRGTNLALVAPITSTVRGHGMEVPVNGNSISGVVLCQQVKVIDYIERNVEKAEKAPAGVTNEALKKVRAILA